MSCEDLFAKITEECTNAESKPDCMRTHLMKDNHSMECAVDVLVETMEKPATQLGWFGLLGSWEKTIRKIWR